MPILIGYCGHRMAVLLGGYHRAGNGLIATSNEAALRKQYWARRNEKQHKDKAEARQCRSYVLHL